MYISEAALVWVDIERTIYSKLFLFVNQGGATRDPPDQSQDDGLSGANNSQATPPIPVPAIVKVSNI